MIQSYNKYLLLRKTSNEGLLALERSIKTFERRDASL